MLHINDLTYRIAGRTLFEHATVAVASGHKVGLVGRNGTGKSTLFKLILGELHPDAGSISLRPRARLGIVAQEAPSGPQSLIDFVLSADTERAALTAEAETAVDPHRIAHVHERLAAIDAHTAPARAARILAGLGFDEAAQGRPLDEFSGGWRMRVALAATLFVAPEMLLLDEPTNHLDLEATLWLEDHLAGYRGTLLVISHERNLLNKVVDEIVNIEDMRLVRYQGNYDRFERTRAERIVLQDKARARQEDERRRIQAFIDRFKAKASKARQAQSRVKMLERMQPIAAAAGERAISFDFPNPSPLSPPLVALDEVAVGYEPGRPILKNLDLRIDMEDRIGLLGANGNGKSTLVRLLADRLKPMSGRVRKSSKLKIGYFSQHQTEELSPSGTPLSHMAALMPMEIEARVRAHLGRFGFGADKAETKVADLSGGEKARLLFCLMSREAPHVMLLDEPTNHLDIDTREALVQALNAYEGAVVLVSHDPHLIELTCDRLWRVADGECQAYEGDMDDYRRLLAEDRRETRRNDKNGDAPDRKEARRARAERREELAPLRKAAKDAEARLEKLNAERARLTARLADPALYDGPPDKVTEINRQLAATEKAIEETELAWIEAHEVLEKANA